MKLLLVSYSHLFVSDLTVYALQSDDWLRLTLHACPIMIFEIQKFEFLNMPNLLNPFKISPS